MKIVIIGGVAAGMSAASKARRADKTAEIIVIEGGQEVSYGACGLPYFISGANPDLDLMRIRRAEEFIRGGIDVRLGQEAVRLDTKRKVVTVKDRRLERTYQESYDKLVIATGAEPIVPDVPGVTADGIYSVKTLQDGEALSRRFSDPAITNVVIVGGGYIGVEMAEAAAAKGKNTVLIELADRILPSFDAEITTIVAREMTEKKVALHTDERLEQIKAPKGRLEAVITSKASYPADAVILALGVKPRTAFLAGTGIKLNERGAIIVDRKLQTNVADIFAAGDCATVYHELLDKNVYIPLGTNANKQGRLVGENLCGAEREMPGVLGTASIKIFDLEAVRTGLTEQEARQNGIPVTSVFVEAPSHAPYYPNPTLIYIKLVYGKADRRILGAQLIGEQGAVLRGHVLAACIHARMTVDQIGWLDFSYAPPFSMPWDAVHVAANAAR